MIRIFLCVTLALTLNDLAAQTNPPKYAYVDTDYVVSHLPETEEMKTQLESTQKTLQQEYEKKRQQIQSLFQEYSANAASLPDSVKQKAEEAINALNAEIKSFPEEADKTLTNTQNFYMATIYLKVGNAIRDVSVEKGYSVIFPASIQGKSLLLYAEPRFDISDLVLEKLGVKPASNEQKK